MKIDARLVECNISCHINYLLHVYFSVGNCILFSNILMAVCYYVTCELNLLLKPHQLFDFDFFPINDTYIRCQQKGLLI